MMCPTKKQLQGLNEILGLAQADVDTDPGRWPAQAAVHSGLAFLRRFVARELAVHGGAKP